MTSPRVGRRGGWGGGFEYLSRVLVDCDVDDAVVVAALLQDGLLDGEVPVLPDLPENKIICERRVTNETEASEALT